MHFLLIFKNTAAQAVNRFITTLTTLVVTIVLASFLGVSGYGDFTKVIALITIFYMVVDFGMNAIYLQEKDTISFKTLLATRLIVAAVFWATMNIVFLVLPYDELLKTGFSPTVKISLFIYSFSLFSQAILQSALGVFQQEKKYDKQLVATIIGSLLTLFILFYLAMQSILTLSNAVFAIVTGGFVSSLLAIRLAHKNLHIDTVNMKLLLKKSLPLGLMLLFNLVYFRADMIILSFYQSSFDVGVYGLSYRVFDFLIALPLFLSNALYPLLIETEKNIQKFAQLVKTYLILGFLASLIIVLVFWYITPFFVVIDKDFSHAALPFRILLLSFPVFVATSILQWVLIAKKHMRFLLYIYLVLGLINVIANILFIPLYSYSAAAVITGVSELLVLIVLFIKILSAGIFTKNNESG